jgi:hypothetical protein
VGSSGFPGVAGHLLWDDRGVVQVANRDRWPQRHATTGVMRIRQTQTVAAMNAPGG